MAVAALLYSRCTEEVGCSLSSWSPRPSPLSPHVDIKVVSSGPVHKIFHPLSVWQLVMEEHSYHSPACSKFHNRISWIAEQSHVSWVRGLRTHPWRKPLLRVMGKKMVLQEAQPDSLSPCSPEVSEHSGWPRKRHLTQTSSFDRHTGGGPRC